MEIEVWNFDDRELKNNPEIAEQHKQLLAEYSKYAIILGYLE